MDRGTYLPGICPVHDGIRQARAGRTPGNPQLSPASCSGATPGDPLPQEHGAPRAGRGPQEARLRTPRSEARLARITRCASIHQCCLMLCQTSAAHITLAAGPSGNGARPATLSGSKALIHARIAGDWARSTVPGTKTCEYSAGSVTLRTLAFPAAWNVFTPSGRAHPRRKNQGRCGSR